MYTPDEVVFLRKEWQKKHLDFIKQVFDITTDDDALKHFDELLTNILSEMDTNPKLIEKGGIPFHMFLGMMDTNVKVSAIKHLKKHMELGHQAMEYQFKSCRKEFEEHRTREKRNES